jgi:hypothetical protein
MGFGKNIKSDLKFIAQGLFNSHKKKCFYLGWTGYANLGDEALRDAIFDLFKDDLIFSESRGVLVRSLEKLKLFRFDAVMLGGGTRILRSEQSLNVMLTSPVGKKIVFGTGVANHEFWKDIPDSYGDFSDWRKLLESVSYLGVRGPVSQQLLKDLGLKREVPVIGDPVLYFTRPLSDPKQKKKKLGLNIGTAKHAKGDLLWGRDENAFVVEFSKFLREMLKKDWEMEFVPVYPKDVPVIESAIKMAGGEGRITIFKDYHSVSKTLDRMEQYDMFIGQKLHSVILSYCANTPSIMVEYRPKCRDFMESIGMKKFNLRTSEFSIEKVTPLVDELYTNLEAYRIQSNKVCLEYKQRLKAAVRTAMDTLR